jgi:hypothetical protein
MSEKSKQEINSGVRVTNNKSILLSYDMTPGIGCC